MIDRRSRLRGVLIARRSVPLIIGVHRAGWLITIGCPRVVTKVRSMFDRGILFNSSRSSDYFSFQRPHGRPLRYFAFFRGVFSFSPCPSSIYWYFNVSRLWSFRLVRLSGRLTCDRLSIKMRASPRRNFTSDFYFLGRSIITSNFQLPALIVANQVIAVCLQNSPFKQKILLLKFTISTSQESRIFPF